VQGKTAGTGEQDWIELKKKSKEIQAAAIEERGRPNDGKKYARPAAGGIARGREEPPSAVGRTFIPTKTNQEPVQPDLRGQGRGQKIGKINQQRKQHSMYSVN
jgi:hypothetical protein